MKLEKRTQPQAPAPWQRAQYLPVLPLGPDGRRVTGSKAHIDLALHAAREGMVLLKNNGVLPLKKGQSVAVFGIAQWDYVRGGTGSGVVHCAFEKTLADGLMEKDEAGQISLFAPLVRFYYDALEQQRKNARENGYFLPQLEKTFRGRALDNAYYFIGRASEPALPEALLSQAAAFTDTAIVAISRMAGESYDRTPEEFRLTEQEKALLETVQESFTHVIVTVNSGGQIEAGWMEHPRIDAVLLMTVPGQMGGTAAAEVLCGDVNPSGKLAFTYARDYADYPSAASFFEDPYYVNYTEDIYVGYRYFETVPGAGEKVVYPFGYGLSYTQFSRKVVSAEEKDGAICIAVEIQNTGDMAGKEVVQLYYGAPQGKLGKAAKSLADFQKTRLLQPGESQVMRLRVKPEDMASYDDRGAWQKSAYLLEQGAYPIFVGSSVRDVTLAYTYTVAEPFRVVRQLQEQCPCVSLPKRMRADGSYETLPIGVLSHPRRKDYPAIREKSASDILGQGDLAGNAAAGVRPLEDVLDGKMTLDAFIRQLDTESLAELLGGVPCPGVSGTSGFGGLTKWGIPTCATADAPAGLRTYGVSGVHTTCFPAAALMGCTWNTELMEAEGEAIGLEYRENNIYAWLGPSMNIQRDPMCGRNFEYYAEDPLLSGKLGAAAVRGVQKNRISGCPKHFAANNKEAHRRDSDSRVSERALREIYLKGFEICVREADPKTLMTSYNYINGIRCSESPDLLIRILREEWGFRGMVMSDWSGHGRHAVEVAAGNDLKMPRGDKRMLLAFLSDSTLTQGQAEEAARNILKLILWYEGVDLWQET